MQCELEFKKLDSQTDYVKKVEPLIHTAKLLLGSLCVCLSANWLTVIVIELYSAHILGMDIDSTNYVDLLINFTLNKGLDYVSNLIFLSMAFYLLAVTIKGNMTLGFRFASPLFYPMRKNETQMDSFMFNVWLLNACSLGIT
jgi:hypothetical protein